MTFHAFKNKNEAFSFASKLCADAIRKTIETNAHASMLLSGGTTPAPLYERLSHETLSWSRVDIGLVDERWVEPDDQASNERLVRTHFLQNNASAASFVPMKIPSLNAESAKQNVDDMYKPFAKPSVAIIGMGPDGHTASWFPESKGLDEAMNASTSKRVQAIDATNCAVAGAHTSRMTVTMPVLANADTVLLLISGNQKRTVLQEQSSLPIHKLFTERDDQIETVWIP